MDRHYNLSQVDFDEVEWFNQFLQECEPQEQYKKIQEHQLNLRVIKKQLEDDLTKDFQYIQNNQQSIENHINSVANQNNSQSETMCQLMQYIQELQNHKMDQDCFQKLLQMYTIQSRTSDCLQLMTRIFKYQDILHSIESSLETKDLEQIYQRLKSNIGVINILQQISFFDAKKENVDRVVQLVIDFMKKQLDSCYDSKVCKDGYENGGIILIQQILKLLGQEQIIIDNYLQNVVFSFDEHQIEYDGTVNNIKQQLDEQQSRLIVIFDKNITVANKVYSQVVLQILTQYFDKQFDKIIEKGGFGQIQKYSCFINDIEQYLNRSQIKLEQQHKINIVQMIRQQQQKYSKSIQQQIVQDIGVVFQIQQCQGLEQFNEFDFNEIYQYIELITEFLQNMFENSESILSEISKKMIEHIQCFNKLVVDSQHDQYELVFIEKSYYFFKNKEFNDFNKHPDLNIIKKLIIDIDLVHILISKQTEIIVIINRMNKLNNKQKNNNLFNIINILSIGETKLNNLISLVLIQKQYQLFMKFIQSSQQTDKKQLAVQIENTNSMIYQVLEQMEQHQTNVQMLNQYFKSKQSISQNLFYSNQLLDTKQYYKCMVEQFVLNAVKAIVQNDKSTLNELFGILRDKQIAKQLSQTYL